MLRLFREARKRWRTLSEVREEMQALRDENAKLAEAVRKYAEENEACMVLVRALRDVNADLDAKLIKWRELWPDWSRSSRRDSGATCEPHQGRNRLQARRHRGRCHGDPCDGRRQPREADGRDAVTANDGAKDG